GRNGQQAPARWAAEPDPGPADRGNDWVTGQGAGVPAGVGELQRVVGGAGCFAALADRDPGAETGGPSARRDDRRRVRGRRGRGCAGGRGDGAPRGGSGRREQSSGDGAGGEVTHDIRPDCMEPMPSRRERNGSRWPTQAWQARTSPSPPKSINSRSAIPALPVKIANPGVHEPLMSALT